MNDIHVLKISAPFILLLVFSAIFFLNWLGYRVRKRVSRLRPKIEAGLGTAEGSLLGLMALLLAFSFGASSSKFESRRQLIIDEANQINNAILRARLLPDSFRHLIMPDLKNYLEARIEYYNAGDNEEKNVQTLQEARNIFQALWEKNAGIDRRLNYIVPAEQMAQSLIGMGNALRNREAVRLAPVPTLIIMVLLILIFMSSFLAGYGVKVDHWNSILSFAFALMTTAVLYLIIELSSPRQGLINLDRAEKNIVDLRNSFR
jgi:hypothetical protein